MSDEDPARFLKSSRIEAINPPIELFTYLLQGFRVSGAGERAVEELKRIGRVLIIGGFSTFGENRKIFFFVQILA